jgi:peptide/nickel transport system ATP-binding protein/oligopeptide transport system ATP-binding protein
VKSKNLLEVKNLKTYYYTEDGVVKAVDGVTFEISYGETLGLVGESGCGKSTVAYSIMRLISDPPGKIVEGEIIFEDVDLLKLDDGEMRNIRGGEIAMIFQDPMSSLNPIFKIGDQVGEAILTHQKIIKEEAKTRVINILNKVGITDSSIRYSHFPHEFSGGMRQRIMIAMGLSCNPKLIIADEPTTSLDVTIQAQVLELMKELIKEFRSSVFLVTHNLGVIAETADKTAVMYAGKIVEYTDTITIFKAPKHPYTKALMGSIPSPEKKRGDLEVIPGVVPNLINPPLGCRFHPRCKFVLAACKKLTPTLIEINQGHFVACLRVKEDIL